MSDVKDLSETSGMPVGGAKSSTRDENTTSSGVAAGPRRAAPITAATTGIPDHIGPARVLRTLGAGAAGTVFLGEMDAPRDYAAVGARVAIKVLHPGLLGDEVATTRFEREAQLGCTLDYPAVVRAFESGEMQVGPVVYRYLIMEFVEGQTLRELMTELGRVPESLLRTIALQAAGGLERIHGAGAVHRDLKPRNLLITGEHQVKLMDLGVALLEDEAARLTRTGHFVGTLLYCAPEQIRGERVTPLSDLYSLGVILYEGATGTNPFEAASAQAVMRRHLELTPPRAGTQNPSITRFFEELLAALLDKRPEQRLSSAAELRTILEAGEASAWWRERGRQAPAAEGMARRTWVARSTSFVGRSNELKQLEACFHDAAAGHGRLVLIEGESGVGKTRLVDEFVRGLEAQGDEHHLLYGAYPPGGGAEGPGAFVQAVVGHFGETGLEAGIARYLAQAPRLIPGFTAALLGTPPRPGTEALNAGGLVAALCYFARGLAAERPLVWILEDLEYASADSRSRLPAIAWALADQRVLIIGTALPGLPVEDLAQLQRLELTRRIPLGRLARTEVEVLLEEAFRSGALAERLAARMIDRAGGNPFFLLETIRDLKDRRMVERLPDGSYTATHTIDHIEIPGTVRDLLLARVAGIALDERQMLEVGAVQGLAFDPDLVARVLERNRLDVLQRLSEVERRHGVVRASGTSFVFDNQQLREVMYQGLPPLLSREYHARVANAYEERSGLGGTPPEEIRGEAAVYLAEHFLRGAEAARGARLVLRALEHLSLRHQNQALVELARLALALPGALAPGARADVRLLEAEALRSLSRRAEELKAVEDAIASAPDEARAARARRALGRLLQSFSDFTGARGALLEAVERARGAGDVETEARALGNLGDVFLNLGDLPRAAEHHQRSQELCRTLGDRAGEARATLGAGAVLAETGELDLALATCSRAEGLYRDLGHPQGEVRAGLNGGLVLLRLGRTEEARIRFERTVQRSRELGDRVREAVALGCLGGTAHAEGDLAAARQQLERSLALFRDMVDRLGEVATLIELGQVALDEGAPAEAEQHITFALNVCRALGIRPLLAEAMVALGNVQRARGEASLALATHTQALDTARSLGWKSRIAPAALALARDLLESREPERSKEVTALLAEAAAAAVAAPATAAPLVAAYQALAGDGGPTAAAVEASLPAGVPAAVEAEVALVLHRAEPRAKRLARARELLGELSAHLDAAGESAFWRLNPTARGVRAEEARLKRG